MYGLDEPSGKRMGLFVFECASAMPVGLATRVPILNRLKKRGLGHRARRARPARTSGASATFFPEEGTIPAFFSRRSEGARRPSVPGALQPRLPQLPRALVAEEVVTGVDVVDPEALGAREA